MCNYLPWRSTGEGQGQKSILYSHSTVLHGEFNPLNPLKRLTLGAKVKVMKGHVPGFVWCESSSLLNVPRAALAVNRYGEASENRSENTTERIRRARLTGTYRLTTRVTGHVLIVCCYSRCYAFTHLRSSLAGTRIRPLVCLRFRPCIRSRLRSLLKRRAGIRSTKGRVSVERGYPCSGLWGRVEVEFIRLLLHQAVSASLSVSGRVTFVGLLLLPLS